MCKGKRKNLFALLTEGVIGNMIKSKKLIVLIVVILICSVLLFLMFEFRERNLKPELIDEIKVYNLDSTSDKDYFFIKSDEYNNFYDGVELLKQLIPDYDVKQLDTEQFTYVVSVNGTITEINYSGKNCKMRNAIGLPVTYTAFLDYKKTNDDTVRIYKIKKVNIDYDYHSVSV